MSRYTVAYYFKAIIKDMPDEYNTINQVNAYVRKALTAAVARAEEASWKMLPMSYEQFCYCWDLDEDKNRFKTMWPDTYDEDSYEVQMRYMENPNKDPKDLYNNGCYSHYEMKFEYKNPKNNKNYRLKKQSFYNTSSPFAAFLCNWDDVWEEEEIDE